MTEYRLKDLYYLAGMMDADGCFNITRCRKSYVPRMMVLNTNFNIIEWLQKNFGGIVSRTTVKNKPNWKPRFTWRLSHRKALDLTDLIVDKLIIKDQQAVLFRTYACVQDSFKKNERSECYEYLQKVLKKMNLKGVQLNTNG